VTVKGVISFDGGEGGDVLDLTEVGVLSLHSIGFNGNDGDDQILIEADRMRVWKQVGLSMNDGDDRVKISADGRINGYLLIFLDDGDTQEAEVSGRLANLQIGGNLHFSSLNSEYFTADSADTIALRNVAVGGSCHIFTGAGDSDVSIDDLNVADELWLSTSDGNDTVKIETGVGVGSSIFRKESKIRLWDGDDILQIGNGTAETTPAIHHARFLGGVEIDGGSGTNAVNGDLLTANFFARDPVITGF
jgi:hypothetical protein